MKLKDKSFVNRPLSNEVANALQDMALDEKIMMTMNKIDEWEHATKGKWYVSFSGGKDSTVLAYLAAKYLAGFVVPPHPLRLVFADTGLEYPEIRFFVMKYPDFLKSRFPSLEVELTRIRPDVRFDHVISDYGYPLITKEVSEAIYYARRIRPYGGAERERESMKTTVNKRPELLGIESDGNAGNYLEHTTNTSAMSEMNVRRTNLMPGWNGRAQIG